MNSQDQQAPRYYQGHAQAPVPVMQQQTQASPQPVVLVNQQMNGRQTFLRHPHLRRGVQFNNGCRVNGVCFMALYIVGGFLICSGFMNFILVGFHGIYALVIGVVLVGIGLGCTSKAKKQFNSLPQDHPDRLIYGWPPALRPSQAPAVQPTYSYTAPSMQHQVMPNASTPGGYVMYYPAQPGGQGQASAQPQLVANYAPSAPVPHAGYHPSMQSTYVPENDPPPAYSDVVKDA